MRTALIAIFFILILGMAWVLTYGLMGGFDKEPASTTMPNPITTEPTPTPTPTPTPSPTPTSTPTPTPTPTPTGTVEFLTSSSYWDGLGYFNIVGEVQNNSNANIEYVKVIASYYDEENSIIGTSFTYTELDILVPGQNSPFEVSSYPDTISSMDSYRIQLTFSTTLEEPFSGLMILSHTSKIDAYDYHKIVGEVKNTASIMAEFVKIVATYYDSQGTVIGTSFTYAAILDLNPEQTSPFEISSYPRKLHPDSYSLQVQGREE